MIFFGVGRNTNDVFTNTQSHFGALINILLSSMFGSAQPVLFAIPEERPIFLREYSTNHYSAGAYFLSKFTTEAFLTFLQIMVQCVITYFLIGFQTNIALYVAISYALAMASTAIAVLLGCAVSDPKTAQELVPLLFVPQMLFSGFFVAINLLPNWLQWVQYICSLTYAVRLGLLAEFEDCAIRGEGTAAENCRTVLINTNANPNHKWFYWLVLVALIAVVRLGALIILKRKATRFY